MAQKIMAKCFVMSGIMLIISTFGNLINLVNNYDNYVQNMSSHIVSAFDG